MASSVVVSGAADVVVQDHRPVRGGAASVTIEPGPQDRDETGVAERADGDRPGGSRFHPFGFVGARQAQDAERRADPLFGMAPSGENGFDQRRRMRADFGGLAAQPLRRALGEAAVGGRHVLRGGAVAAPVVAGMRASSSVLASANGTL